MLLTDIYNTFRISQADKQACLQQALASEKFSDDRTGQMGKCI